MPLHTGRQANGVQRIDGSSLQHRLFTSSVEHSSLEGPFGVPALLSKGVEFLLVCFIV